MDLAQMLIVFLLMRNWKTSLEKPGYIEIFKMQDDCSVLRFSWKKMQYTNHWLQLLDLLLLLLLLLLVSLLSLLLLCLLLDYTSLSPGGSCSTGYVPQSGSFLQDTCGRIRSHFIFVSGIMSTFIHLFIHISINASNLFLELLTQSPACFLCLYCFVSLHL